MGGEAPSPVAWRALVGSAMASFAASRVIVLVGAALFSALRRGTSLVDVLTSWDGPYYLEIMARGYPNEVPLDPWGDAATSPLAFFPGYPLVARALDLVLPGHEVTAALVTSTLFGGLATVAVGVLVARGWGEDAGRRAALLFAVYPGNIVLSMVLTEGLMVVAATACLIALQRRWWLAAGAAGAVATLTRPAAAAVIVACAWGAAVALKERREVAALVAPVLAAAGLVSFHLYLWARTGERGVWFRVQEDGWQQGTDFDLSSVWRPVTDLLTFDPGGAGNVIRAVAGVLVVAGLVALVRLRPPGVVLVYTVSILALTAVSGLGLRPRFLIAAFPLLIPAAVHLRDRSTALVAAVSAGLIAPFLLYSMLSYELYFGTGSMGL